MPNYLDDVPEQNAFILGDKKILNLFSLLLELRSMSDETYNYYASSHHNYFADWIMHVVNYHELADKLRNTSSRQQAIRVLEKSVEEHKEKDVKEDSFVVAETKPKMKKPVKKAEEKEKAEPLNKVPNKMTENNVMLQDIAQNEKEIKDFLWKHFAWDMAKEFMYGMAIGILIGMVLSKIFIRN